MSTIRLTPGQLESIAGQLQSGAANIESTLSSLRSQAAPLQSEWQGVAQTRFEHYWEEWNRGAAQLHDALTNIARMTRETAVGFQDFDQRAMR